MLLSADIIRHIEGQVMIIFAVRDGDAAAIGRSAGARALPDGDIELRVSRQWRDAANAARIGGFVAATFTAPADYRSYQVKGHITALTPCPDDEARAAETYVTQMLAAMGALGVTRAQLSHTLPLDDLICLRLRPDSLFEQTPGPRAGHPLTEGGV
ncbi:MAG: hypothetical protein QM667_10460 [Asticcacaulis sp.]